MFHRRRDGSIETTAINIRVNEGGLLETEMYPFYGFVVHQVNMILTNNYIESRTGTSNVAVPFDCYRGVFWLIKG